MRQDKKIDGQFGPTEVATHCVLRGQSSNRCPGSAIFLWVGLFLIFFSMAQLAQAQSAGGEAAPVAGSAAIMNVIRWSGSLPESAGRAVEMRFSIFEDQAGGMALWSEAQTVNVAADGKYSVLLGGTSAEGLPVALFEAGQARWIEARLAGPGSDADARAPSAAAASRALLAAVPYALKAVDAESLAGRAAADYVTREDLRAAVAASGVAAAQVHPDTTLAGSGTAGYVPLWASSSNLGNSVMAETGTSIGIDTATPATTLDVNGTTTLRGNVSMPALGTATASGGFSSPVFAMSGSSFMNGGVASNQKFAWEVQAQGNNTASPSSLLSLLYASGTAGLNNTGLEFSPTGSIYTKANVRVAPTAAATAAGGASSPQFVMEANTFNSSSASSIAQQFAFAAAPAGNNTASPSANLDLMFGSGSASPSATGLSFSPTGVISFVSGQTFPTAQLETALNGVYPQLATQNTFASSAVFDGSVTAHQAGGLFTSAVTGQGTSGAAGTSGSSDSGTGVAGVSGTWFGVLGNSQEPVAGAAGVFGFLGNESSTHNTVTENNDLTAGVWGDNANENTSANTYAGVVGTGVNTYGGAFFNNSAVYPALYAENLATGTSPTVAIEAVANLGDSIYASAVGNESRGVDSLASGNGAYGVYGESDGTIDSSTGNSSIGIKGIDTGADGYGVVGDETAAGGYGVYGHASGGPDSVRGTPVGVYGLADSGTGVMGIYNGNSGTFNHYANGPFGSGTPGVWGDTSSGGAAGVAVAGVVGTADNDEAGFFVNDSAEFPAVLAFNNGSGGNGLFKVFKASTGKGTCGMGDGDLSCTGQMKSLVTTGGGAHTVETYAMQSPENWMEDFGSGLLERGVAVVKIDPAFADTVSAAADYHVFITPNGDSKGLYVIRKTATSFEVRESGGGVSSLSFDYRIVARRRGYEAQRLTDVTERFNTEQAELRRYMKTGGSAHASSGVLEPNMVGTHQPISPMGSRRAMPGSPRPAPRPVAPGQGGAQVHPAGATGKR
jgi:hypothetical protein